MLLSTPAATAAIEGHANTGAYRVTISLPGGVYSDVTLAASSIQIDAGTTTDAPAGSRLQPGYAARTATVSFAGLVDQRDATKTAAWLFGPYSTTSPLYRQRKLFVPITIDMGVYVPGSAAPEWYRRFTGRADSVSVNPVTGEVTVVCIDSRTQLRSSVAVPAVVTAPPYNAGLTSEYALDAILRAGSNGKVSSWPATRSKAVLSVGLRTSTWPEVGSLWSGQTQSVPSFGPGAFGSALNGQDSTDSALNGTFWVPSVDVSLTQSSFFAEMWVKGLSASSNLSFNFGKLVALIGTPTRYSVSGLRLGVLLGSLQVFDGLNSSSWSVPALDGNGHYVAIYASQNPGTLVWSGTLYLDGTTNAFTLPGAAVAPFGPADKVSLQLSSGTGVSVEALQVTSDTAAPPANSAFSPRAVLDPSLNALQVTPGVTGDAWAAIQAICDAETGVGLFDESDVFRFYNRVTLRSRAAARSMTSRQSLMSLSSQESAAGLFNHARATYTPWNFGAVGLVYSLDAPYKVPKNSTVVFTTTVPTDGSLFAFTGSYFSVQPNSVDTPATNYYRASTTVAGSAEHPGIVVRGVQTNSGTVQITLVNSTGIDAWLVSPANYTDAPVGTPWLRVKGIPATPAASALVAEAQWPPIDPDGSGGAASDPNIGDVAYDFPDNPWRQDADTAGLLVVDALGDGAFPSPLLPSIEVFPDPRTQLTDRIHLLDPDVSGMDEYVQVWGTSYRLEAGSWSQSISATAVARPGGWILGVAGRSELALTTAL